MDSNSRSYILTLLGVTVLYVLLYGLFFMESYKAVYAPLTFITILAGSAISHFLVKYISVEKGKPFVQIVMITFVFRLILYSLLAFALIIILEDPFNDLILFGTFYLLLVLHEIAFILLRPFQK